MLIYYTSDPSRIHDNYITLGERHKNLIIKIGHSAENCWANDFVSKVKVTSRSLEFRLHWVYSVIISPFLLSYGEMVKWAARVTLMSCCPTPMQRKRI